MLYILPGIQVPDRTFYGFKASNLRRSKNFVYLRWIPMFQGRETFGRDIASRETSYVSTYTCSTMYGHLPPINSLATIHVASLPAGSYSASQSGKAIVCETIVKTRGSWLEVESASSERRKPAILLYFQPDSRMIRFPHNNSSSSSSSIRLFPHERNRSRVLVGLLRGQRVQI